MRYSLFLLMVLCINLVVANAQGTIISFSYQGNLNVAGAPANGQFDFLFKLYDSGGTQLGSDLLRDDLQVTNGFFSTYIAFGTTPFVNNTGRTVEVWVRPGASTGAYTPLAPRVALQSTPYSIKSFNADYANDALQLGGVSAGAYVQTTDPRLTDARNPLPNSTNYIQNTSTQQSASNFNISGNGTLGGTLAATTVNATGHYRINNVRVLSTNGPFNDGTLIYAASNTFTGDGAGLNTTPAAPVDNGIGKFNSFFGAGAGKANTTGYANAFFGFGAGEKNVDGLGNAFFGQFTGNRNTSGSNNSFFGVNAGINNISGGNNSFFGVNTGIINYTGENNSFFGVGAGFPTGPVINSVGNDNSAIGYASNVAVNLSNQTAVGSRAAVTQNNSLVLGSINGVNGATADTNVGIGTTAPATRLHVAGIGIIRARVNSDWNAGVQLALADVPKWSVATVTGGQFQIFNDAIGQNAFWIDSASNNVGIGTTSPGAKLDVQGTVRVAALGSAGGSQVCINASNVLSSCSSSIRYKENVRGFASGIDLVRQLRPVTFYWKAGNALDMGLVAEEVAEVEPLLVTRNEKGEVEGVKYDQIGVVAVNAIKEQQAEIEVLRKTVERLQAQIDALKKLVCAMNAAAEGCSDPR